jgi:hypothetical protein
MLKHKNTFLRAVRDVYPRHRTTIERLKRDGRQLWSSPTRRFTGSTTTVSTIPLHRKGLLVIGGWAGIKDPPETFSRGLAANATACWDSIRRRAAGMEQ